jgi:hypothetical protein
MSDEAPSSPQSPACSQIGITQPPFPSMHYRHDASAPSLPILLAA